MTSLSRFKTPGALYNELCFKRNGGVDCSFLVVEGDRDSRFWRRKVVDGLCNVMIAGGRRNLEDLIVKVDTECFAGTLGLVDADFSHIDRTSHSPNLIYTEHHDLEAMLLRSAALEAFLDKWGDERRIKTFEEHAGHDIRSALLVRGLAFGRLRFLSHRIGLGIDFDKLPVPRFLEQSRWEVDEAGLNAHAARLCSLSPDDLATRLSTLPNADPWMICQGHDLLQILNIGLAQVLGQTQFGQENIAKVLEVAFQTSELHASSIYRDIRAWESRNPPYLILAHPSQPSP